MKAVQDILVEVANTDLNVLIVGEKGIGKEAVARYVHNRSPRRDKPFIKVDSTTLVQEFNEHDSVGQGKEMARMYNAYVDKFELANRGSLYLHRIENIHLDLQVTLLRVLQKAETLSLGDEDRVMNVRILASAVCDLEEAIRQGRFREELFYRLNVLCIHLPPLRERKEDLPELVKFFIEKTAHQYHKKLDTLSDQHIDALMQYQWPGNLRELENLIASIAISGDINGCLDKLRNGNHAPH